MKLDIALKTAETLVEHLRPACERIEPKDRVARLMGYKKLETTMIYTHVEGASEVRSPLDRQLGTPFIRRVHVES